VLIIVNFHPGRYIRSLSSLILAIEVEVETEIEAGKEKRNKSEGKKLMN
jgi:hypothetical protein